MAAQRGRLMLIYSGSGGGKTLIGGLKSTSIKMNNSVIDVSTKDTAGWRELLEDGSLKFFSIACQGIFKDSATDESIRSRAFSNSIDTYTFEFPNGDIIVCDFQITGYERAGDVEGVETYNYTLESTGEPSFTAA
ncbi:phage tail tube protein [Tundrisphaera lichenicola]|uniref:phage tail tube protein n=1 Tax=Tundrisphaera lichenicola TaxID=2029860 RepID=UPI003EBE6BB3